MLFANRDFISEIKEDKPIKVAVIGEWRGHPNGSFKVLKQDLESMLEDFNQKKIDVVIDYEHQSLKNQKAPAAGWIKSLFIEDNALFANAEFNEEAKNYIKNKQYRYLSPVFEFNSKDNKSGEIIKAKLHSVALTNTPFIDELGELIANSNKFKGEIMDKQKELEEQIIALKNEKEELLKNLEALKKEREKQNKQMANSLVENAISSGKIANSQKEWALSYACKDLEGFNTFLATHKETPPTNNLYANKAQAKKDDEVDVVNLILGE
ncbi:hypothetical protein B6S12_09925 [Helicobacter valdiviensis]|uniref:Mu-like prophage I protein n=1 Tax=Helicobacter valdiviensis TaxID=1458358 RepID=A0A2W6NIT7_9HELI|nr:phage protease [Helicobacter valdiviensis]PZT47276.1 hypothetical protein B6S12_09925 [Helicobacter valdiviensis]